MKLRVAVLTLSLSFVFGQPSVANEAVGVWMTDEGKAKVRLSECGQHLCSEIIWLRDPTDENGRPLRDLNNPDPRLRNRTIIGLEILQDLTPAGPGRWQGQIYNPENGKMYVAHLAVGGDTLQLKGCVSWGWPCGEQTWTRVTGTASQQRPNSRADARPGRATEPQMQSGETLPWASNRPSQQVRAEQPARPSQPAVAATTSQLQPAPAARRDPAPQMARASAAPAAAAPSRGSLDGDDYLVQIAARRSENEAKTAFSELQRQFPDLLGSYQPLIQAADLGSKGIWYRVRVGPMDEKNSAAAFCQQLKSAGGDCIVRRHE